MTVNWSCDDRLQWVRMQYRLQGATGADAWSFALAPDDRELELHEAETQEGSATGDWKVPNTDGTYEIRLKALCSNTVGPEYDEHLSSVITGVVDRAPPRLLFRTSEVGAFSPGDAISAAFSERINCQRVSATMDLDTTRLSVADGDLMMACSDRTLYLQFAPSVQWSSLVGASIQ